MSAAGWGKDRNGTKRLVVVFVAMVLKGAISPELAEKAGQSKR
jgi:hypothetical protein